MYHWIHTLEKLGRNDAAVTSNHLFTNVYLKNGQKTYGAYNFEKSAVEVKFSDGFTMTIQPSGMTVKSAEN